MDVSLIEPLRTALLAQGPLSALATHVWERTTALDTRGSNAIEGNTRLTSHRATELYNGSE